MEQLINITDAVFLGHVGEVELGASALAGIYYLAIYMLGFGFSIGLQVMIARKRRAALSGDRTNILSGIIVLVGDGSLALLFHSFCFSVYSKAVSFF